jgi:RHS repeat-associated protein
VVKTWHRSVSGDTTVTTYDALFPTRVKVPGGSLYKSTLNALGWLTTRYDAVDTTKLISYRYDIGGRLTSWTNRRSQRVDVVYDSLGRVIKHSGTNIPTDTLTYSSNGLIQTMARGTISLDSTYMNVSGQPDSVVHRFGGHRYAFLYAFAAYSYGQRVSETITTDAGITFLSQAEAWRPAATTLDSVAVSPGTASGSVVWTSNNAGNVTQVLPPVGAAKSMSYTAGNQLSSESIGSVGTAVNDSLARDYALDTLGRIAVDQRITNTGYTSRTYVYDGMGRLLKVQRATESGCTKQTDSLVGKLYSCTTVTPTSTVDSVGYDVAGNRTLTGATYTSTGNRLLTWPGAVGTITMTYDADGNVISRTYNGSTDSLFWGATNMLDSEHVTGGTRYKYDYNSMGQPVRLSVNGNVFRWWLWNGNQLIAELDSAGTHRRSQYLYHGGTDQAYAIVTDSGGSPLVRYLQQDARGNVTGVIRGTKLVQYTQYTAWGDIDAQSINAMPDTNRMGWQGLMHASDAAPYYFVRNRMYDVQTGRFLNEDPIGIVGGTNVYAFAGDDPINGRDPTGEDYYQDQCHKYYYYGLYYEGTYCSLVKLAVPPAGSYFGCHIALAGTPISLLNYDHCALSSYGYNGMFQEQWELLTAYLCSNSQNSLCNDVVTETKEPSDEATFSWVYLSGVSFQTVRNQANILFQSWQSKPYSLPGGVGFISSPKGTLGNSNTYACTLLNSTGYTLSYADANITNLFSAPLQNCNIGPYTNLNASDPGDSNPWLQHPGPGVYNWWQ